MATLIWVYGALQGILNMEMVNEQILLSHLLYNEYIYIERRRRKAYRRFQLKFQDIRDEYEKVTEIEFEARETFKLYKKTRHLPPGTPGKTSKAAVFAIYSTLIAARKKFEKAIRSHIKELNPNYEEIDKKWGIHGTERKIKRAASGVFWGTEAKIAQAATQAIKAKVEYFDVNGNPRNVVPWEHAPAFRDPDTDFEKGLIAVQIQNGMLIPDVFNKNSKSGFLRIDPISASAFDESIPRNQRKKLQYTTVHLRVGSTGPGNRNPVWASFPVFLHRALPEAQPGKEPPTITWAVITRKPWNQGFKYRWELHLTVDVPSAPAKRFENAVAINLGWRKVEGGDLRVATWVDSNGESGHLLLDSNKFRSRIETAENKRSYRDTCQNELQAYLISHGVPCQNWKSPKRYKDLQQQGILFPEVQAHLDAWVKEDHHHWCFERGTRQGALRYRREQYRLLALKMSKKYDVVIIEKYSIRDIAENENRLKEPSAQRVEGSPSQAREIIRSTAMQHGCLIIEGQSRKATQRCNLCGCEEPWDAAPEIEHRCVSCKEIWDQDINNAKNMLDRAAPILGSPEALEAAYQKQIAKKPARFAKKHKKHEPDPEETETSDPEEEDE